MLLDRKIKILSRPSNLALKQVEEVCGLFPQLQYEIVPLLSYGDRNKEISLMENVPSDFFTRELDEALIAGQADIAVHSAKDLPYPMREGLEIIALLEALDKTDALVSRNSLKLSELKKNCRIGTSSSLRKRELLRFRPDAQIVSVRGTIEERIALVDRGEIDALIVATCALKRLGLEHRISEILPFETHPLQGHISVISQAGNESMKAIFGKVDIRKRYGKVFLVGFGPGDPEMLTIKALKVLRSADVIVYDDLTPSDYLSIYQAEKIYVGKRKGYHAMEQEQINRLLYQKAIAGKSVVRLKGGDPFIFGRGGEELRYLQERLVDVEIIPGITSSLAAGAYTKIPLTQREISSSVAFCSGYPEDNIRIPDADTLVFYMAASNVKKIALRMIESGKSLDTPVAICYNISLPDQKIYVSTLRQIVNENKDFISPITIIVGDVVRLNHWISREKSKLLVTGTSFYSLPGFNESVHTPLIRIMPLSRYDECDAVLKEIEKFDWIIFTSKHAVFYFFQRLACVKNGFSTIEHCKIASIGRVTTKKLLEYGVIPHLEASNESSEGLLKEFLQRQITDKRILIPRSDLASNILPEGLTRMKNKVISLVVYKNSIPENITKVNLNEFDAVLFTSPSCVMNFITVYENIPKHLKLIVKGHETWKKLKQMGIRNMVYMVTEFFKSV